MLRELLTSAKSRIDRVPRRYWVCLLVMLTTFLMSMIRNIEFRILDRLVITDEPAATAPYRPGSYSCPYRVRKQQNPNYYKYSQIRWEADVMETVSNIALWVHLLVHLPMGILSDLFGGNRVILLTLTASSAVTLFTPAAVDADVRGNFYFAMLTFRRVIGPLLPACMSLLGAWALPGERMTFVGFFSSGWFLGHTAGRMLATTLLRWRALYYANAALSALLALLWWTVARAWRFKPTPLSRPPSIQSAPRPMTASARRLPLVELVYSPRLVCLYLFALAAHGLSLMMDQVILHHMRTVLMSDFRNIMNARPELFGPLQLLALTVPCLASAVVSDRLVAAGLVGRVTARRAHTAVGLAGIVVAVTLVVAGECEEGVVVAGYTVAEFFIALQRVVLWNAALDAAPQLAGTLFSLIDIVGCVGIKFLVLAVKWHTSSKGIGDLSVWNAMYAVMVALIVILTAPYLVWGPFHEMPWAKFDATPFSIRAPAKYRLCTMATLILLSISILVIFIII